MKKFLVCIVSLMATVAIAETDYIAMPRIEAIVSGEELIPLVNATDVTATDDVTVGDDLTVTGTVTADAMFLVNTNALLVMSAQTAPLARGMLIYDANKVVANAKTGVLAIAKGTTTNDWIVVNPD